MSELKSLPENRRAAWPIRLASFLPAILAMGSALFPVEWPLHPGPLLALPLYVIAAAVWRAEDEEVSFLAVLLQQLKGGFWRTLAFGLGLSLAMYWPVSHLETGGRFIDVLLLSAVIGLALVILWRYAALPALLLESPSDPLAVRWRRLEATDAGAMLDWPIAVSMLCLGLLGLAAAYWAPMLTPLSQVILGISAVVMAPVLAVLGLGRSQRRVAEIRERMAEALAIQAVAPAAFPGSGRAADQLLFAAARAGRINEALALIDQGANVHALPDPTGRDQRTLAMLAAIQSDLRLLRRVIEAGVDLNQDYRGLTPLMAAVRDSYHGRPDAVLMLLANGADPRTSDTSGQTALHAAARAADPTIAALLLDAGAVLDALDAQGITPLGVAAGHGNVDVAKFLLDRKAAREPEGGEPPLLLAAGREDDDPAMVKLLLRHKARIDIRGRLGRTALHAACLQGNVAIVAALLAARAEPDVPDNNGVTPLLEAARAGAVDCVEKLAAYKATNINARDLSGRNAMVIACQSGRCDSAMVKALLRLGVDPQQPAFDGKRAVDHAVAAGRWAQVALLDPDYVLPTSLAEDDEELQDAPPVMRLRLALEKGNMEVARQWLVQGIIAPDTIASLYLDMAPRLGSKSARTLADALVADARTEEGNALIGGLLRLGPSANPALVAFLDRGASPAGEGGLARYLSAALLQVNAQQEAEKVALSLLERGADPFGRDEGGQPPLLLTLRLKWYRLLEVLLESGVDPEMCDAVGTSALVLACQNHDAQAVRSLIRCGAQPASRSVDGQTARGLALSLGHADLARWMDWPFWSLPRRKLQDADLVRAAQCGDLPAVQCLLDLGLPLDGVDAQGCTTLLRACGSGHVELVQMLLKRGADHRIPALSGATCLSVALTARQQDVVWTLLEAGAEVDQRLPGGITPLMIAAALGQTEGLRALLSHGAQANIADEQGGTALHALAQFGFVADHSAATINAWQALLEAGADPNVVNALSESPLLLVLGASFEPGTSCHEEVILAQLECLLSYGVELDVRDRRGFGPLHLAALHGLGRVVRRLLFAGAKPDLRDVLNRRAADIALIRGYVDIAAEFSPRQSSPSFARFLRNPDS